MAYTVQGYAGWSLRPLGNFLHYDRAREQCETFAASHYPYDAVRVIEDETGDCLLSLEREGGDVFVDRTEWVS